MHETLERFHDAIVGSCPMGRIGEPADMAGVAIYPGVEGRRLRDRRRHPRRRRHLDASRVDALAPRPVGRGASDRASRSSRAACASRQHSVGRAARAPAVRHAVASPCTSRREARGADVAFHSGDERARLHEVLSARGEVGERTRADATASASTTTGSAGPDFADAKTSRRSSRADARARRRRSASRTATTRPIRTTCSRARPRRRPRPLRGDQLRRAATPTATTSSQMFLAEGVPLAPDDRHVYEGVNDSERAVLRRHLRDRMAHRRDAADGRARSPAPARDSCRQAHGRHPGHGGRGGPVAISGTSIASGRRATVSAPG
jgi:hypothetical protein